MADYWTVFSFAVPLETDDEIAWAHLAVALLKARSEDNVEPSDLEAILPDDDWIGYEAEIDDDGLWIHSEECGQPEHVVPLVQEFLLRFRPQDHVGFSWADTCSKPRIDEFGGGACLITAEAVRWMASSTWLDDQIAAIS
jgi:hypothetical protein